MPPGEAHEDRGNQGEQHRLERRPAGRRAPPPARRSEVGLRLLKPLWDHLDALDQDACLRGQPDTAPRGLEQGHSRLGLQLV